MSNSPSSRPAPRAVVVALLAAFATSVASAQQSELSQRVNAISAFVVSDRYARLADDLDDHALVDSLFRVAIRLCDDDLDEALLALTFATSQYRTPSITALGVEIVYPIISPPRDVFVERNRRLPARLFPDSPDVGYGDRDKLAHFFGAAWFARRFLVFDLTDYVGYFVEILEVALGLQREIDPRDLKANRLGARFGERLADEPTSLPSELLRTWIP